MHGSWGIKIYRFENTERKENPMLNSDKNPERPVLLIYGLGDNKDKLEKTLMYVELKKKFNVYIVEYSEGPENAFGDIRDYAQILDNAIHKITDENDVDKVDIVAHSMGGLISRYRIQKIDDSDIGKLIMVGTPNHGSDFSRPLLYHCYQVLITPLSFLSRLFNNKNQKKNPLNQAINEMLPKSDFLFELNGNHATELDVSQGEVIDTISFRVTYYVISGNNLKTFSYDRKNFVNGDGIVPFDSARLSNVTIFPVYALHGEEFNTQEIIDLVQDTLAQPIIP